MNELDFYKMHGLGNDFVIVDQRSGKLSLSPQQIRQIGDRRRGVGFDQLLLLEPSRNANVFMRVYNPDGSEAGACGNGTRCVARLMMEEQGLSRVAIETTAGILETVPGLRGYTVTMGRPGLGWDEIPLAKPMDTLYLDIELGTLSRPTAVSMGNPHAVFFVDDVDAYDIPAIGPLVEWHPTFPEGNNVGFAQIIDRETIRLRVWERGAGLTQACGTGACAALVCAARAGKTDRKAKLILDGGDLFIHWDEASDHVIMTGPVELEESFTA